MLNEEVDEQIERMGVVSMDLELRNTVSPGKSSMAQRMHMGIFLTKFQSGYARTWPQFLSLQYAHDRTGAGIQEEQPAISVPKMLTFQES